MLWSRVEDQRGKVAMLWIIGEHGKVSGHFGHALVNIMHTPKVTGWFISFCVTIDQFDQLKYNKFDVRICYLEHHIAQLIRQSLA